MIGVALVGLGEIGQVHLRAFSDWDQADLCWICDLDDALIARDGHHARATTRDIGEVLADEAVDLVSICLPHHLHAPVAIACLDAG